MRDYIAQNQKTTEGKNRTVISDMEENNVVKQLKHIKFRLKKLEEEADALREKKAKIESEIGSVQDHQEDADSRSVFVGNVDYACTPEEVQLHFKSCGLVNRVTILTNEFGHPKGFAYVEFDEVEAVQEALQLNESQLYGRQLKVLPKRTNVPGMKQDCPWRFNPHMNPYHAPYVYPPNPYGYGKVPRFRGSTRYMPYN